MFSAFISFSSFLLESCKTLKDSQDVKRNSGTEQDTDDQDCKCTICLSQLNGMNQCWHFLRQSTCSFYIDQEK